MNSVPFDFDRHVQKLPYETIENYLLSKDLRLRYLGAISPVRQSRLEQIAKTAKQYHEDLGRNFEDIREFFLLTQQQGYCTSRVLDHYVTFSGAGEESFDINGSPTFAKSPKRTKIPVKKGADAFELTIDGYPLADIPVFGKLTVFYSFTTGFSIGRNANVTHDPTKTHEYVGDIDNRSKILYFFGEGPGNLFYRRGDALHEGILDGVLGHLTFGHKRKTFSMQGKVYLGSGVFLYQGPFDSNGNFPFFIQNNPSHDKMPTTTPIDSTPLELIGAR